MKSHYVIIAALLLIFGCSSPANNTPPGTYILEASDYGALMLQTCEATGMIEEFGMEDDFCDFFGNVHGLASVKVTLEEGGSFSVSQMNEAGDFEVKKPRGAGFTDVAVAADTLNYGGTWSISGDTLALALERAVGGDPRSPISVLLHGEFGPERFVFQGSSLKYIFPEDPTAPTEALEFTSNYELLFKRD